jgi:cytochrome c oxidase assembly factor CtaG
MLQHLLLLLVVPPLLLLGTPRAPLAEVWRSPPLERAVRALTRPAAAWGIGIGTMWIWHLPALYNRALQDGGVHVVQHLSFLVTSVIFWWPVLTPLPSVGVAPLAGILYLLAAALATSVLGIILTFAPAGAYPAYLHPADTLGILPFLRNGWGLSPEIDQQVGGFLMWIPGGLVYLCAIVAVLARWYRAAGAQEAI